MACLSPGVWFAHRDAAQARFQDHVGVESSDQLPDVACVRSGDPRGHQGLEGIGPQAIGTAGEVPLLEVCTGGVVHDR